MVLVILLILAAVVIVLITALTIEIAWENGYKDGFDNAPVSDPKSKWYNRGYIYGKVGRAVVEIDK